MPRLIRFWSCAKCGSRNSDNSLVCMACLSR